jgi:hypothetical protein
MAISRFKGIVDSAAGFSVGGTTVINASGVLVAAQVSTSAQINTLSVGASGTVGSLKVFPATAARGSLRLLAATDTGNKITTISNSVMAQDSVISIPDPGAATANFLLDAGTNAAGTFTAATVGTLTLGATALTATAAEIILNCDQSVYTETLTATSATMSVTKRVHILDTTLGAQAFTPAVPGAANIGVVHVVSMAVDGGDSVLTGTNVIGLQKTTDVPGAATGVSLTFNDVGDSMTMIGVSATKWLVLTQIGGTVA